MAILKVILLTTLSFCIYGCSTLGGGFSDQDPLRMKQELSIDAKYLLDQAFNLDITKKEPALVDNHFHLIGNGQDIRSILAEDCPTLDYSDVPANAKLKSWLNEDRFSRSNPIGTLETYILMNSLKVNNKKLADAQSIDRLKQLVKGLTKVSSLYCASAKL